MSPADQEWAQALLTEEDIAAALGSSGLTDVSASFHSTPAWMPEAPWPDWEAGVSYSFFDGDRATVVEENIGTADQETVERVVEALRAQAEREGSEGSTPYDPAPISNAVIAGFEDDGGDGGGIDREVIVGYEGRVIYLNAWRPDRLLPEGGTLTREEVDQLVATAVSKLP